MGRWMFDFGEEPWGDNPPFHVPVFVLTHDSPEKFFPGDHGGFGAQPWAFASRLHEVLSAY
jgi:hypothetical protein